MTRLTIGPIQLSVSLPAGPLLEEIRTHIQRVIGSRGNVVDRIERRWGRVTLDAEATGEDEVVLLIRGPSGSMDPIGEGQPAPGSSDEVALGYLVGRLLCRNFLSSAAVLGAAALPNGRYLTDLRGVEIAAMPEALHKALGELHVIGFTGMPEEPPGVALWVEGGPVLSTHDPSAEELQAEIEELRRRMAEKFRISDRGPKRFGEPTLEVEIVPIGALPAETAAAALEHSEATQAVKLSSQNWTRGHPDLPLLQWILIHLMKPRRRHPFLPMRPLLIIPRTIPRAHLLPSGDHLADLSAIRHQLMPAKIAQILGDLHRRGGDSRDLLSRLDAKESPGAVDLRFGPIHFTTTREDREVMLNEARTAIAPLVSLFESEGGGAEKYGPVTLDIQPRSRHTLDFVSSEFLPGCPDEILCEFLVGTWIQNGSIPLSSVHRARTIGRRTVVAAPTIQNQLAPGGTVDLIESIHSGRSGPDRRTSGWKYRTDS